MAKHHRRLHQVPDGKKDASTSVRCTRKLGNLAKNGSVYVTYGPTKGHNQNYDLGRTIEAVVCHLAVVPRVFSCGPYLLF